MEMITGPVDRAGTDIYILSRSSCTDDVDLYIRDDGLFFRIEKNMFGDLVIGTSPYPLPFGGYYKLFDFSLPAGVKFTPFEFSTETDDLWCNFWITCESIGTETVNSPNAVYENCIKFRLTVYVRYTPRVTGETVTWSAMETLWFGENTGPVKGVSETYSDGVLVESYVRMMMHLDRW